MGYYEMRSILRKREMKKSKRISHRINTSRKLFLIPLLLILLVGTFISVLQGRNTQQSQSLAGVPKDCSVDSSNLSYSPKEQALLEQINAFRHDNGVPALDSDLTLKQAAAWMSKDLKARNVLVHIDSLGRDTAARFSDCGVSFPSFVGEIIDSGDADIPSIMGAWTHSPSQISRLLNKNFTHIGISLVYGYSSTDTYWTVTFTGPDIKPTYYYPYPSQGITQMPNNPTPTPAQGGGTPNLTLTPGTNKIPTPTSKPKATPTPIKKPTATPTPRPIGGGTDPGTNPGTNPGKNPTLTPPSSEERPPFPFGTMTPTPKPIPGQQPTPDPKKSPCKPTKTINPKFVKNSEDIQIFLAVKFPGIGCDGNMNPKHQSRRLQASIIDVKNKEIKVGTADLQFDGSLFRGTMHLGKIPDGIYSIKLSGVRTLQKVIEPTFQQITSTKLNIMPEVILRPGDVSEDNALTLLDYSLSLSCFQDKKCKADATDFIDFNDSGAADVIDYNLLLQSFYSLSGD
jgi:uncharacterized protein YkwD